MVMTILTTGEKRLVLESEPSSWCRVSLHSEQGSTALGGDTRTVIVERLRAALSDETTSPVAGVLRGVEVRWVLSLAEEHATLFIGNYSGRRTLFIQAHDGSLLETLMLSCEDVVRWRALLGG